MPNDTPLRRPRPAPPEQILDPEIAIIDAHHHLWESFSLFATPRNGAVGWADPAGDRYMLKEFARDVNAGHRIEATVYMECHSHYRQTGPDEMKPVGEVEFATAVGKRADAGSFGPTRYCAAIVSKAELMLGAAVEEVLVAQMAAGEGRLAGVRYLNSWDPHGVLAYKHLPGRPPPGVLRDKTFQEGFAKLAAHGLTFDAWQFYYQLADVAALADAFPDTQIIMGHCGGPAGVGPYAEDPAGVFCDWRNNLSDLAKRPNVLLKLGGMGMWGFGHPFYLRETQPSSVELAAAYGPWVEAAIEIFDPERCMFESNFPVDSASCGYVQLWNAFKRIVRGYSQMEKEAMFAGVAAQAYRIG